MFSMERKWISSNIAHELAPNCPRCASPNTKFCYYNNYSLLQPRYFCKGCRRYWTNGGSLRNVPVGGGCRKNRRSSKQRGSNSQKPSYSLWTSGNTESGSNCGGNSTGKSGNSNSGSSSSSGGSTDSILPDDDQLQHEEINGGWIDVAAVFARFLSEDSSSRYQNLVDVSNSRCPDDQINDLWKEYNNPAPSLPKYDQPLEASEMVNGNNIDDLMLNCSWSKADDLSHLDFTWQSPGEQFQDFGSYYAGVGHQLELPAEYLRDIGNWSCYDLVAIEPSTYIFS